VTQFPPWSSHSPVCTITAVSKDLVRRPTRISYDLSLATLSHELGCLLADSGTIAGSYSTVADALVCSYYVRCVSTQRFWRTFVIIVERAVKLLITRRTSQSSKSSGTVRRTTACPAPQLGSIQPRSKRMTRPCASRTLLSSCLRGQCRLTLWEPDAGRADVARPAFSSIAAMYLCWPRYCAGH